jgi:hypothetical protein
MATLTYALTVTRDARWPEHPTNGPVLEGRLDGRRVIGWWSRKNFDEWVTARSAVVNEYEDGTIHVVAPLTKRELARA